jgi:hypothetical protein
MGLPRSERKRAFRAICAETSTAVPGGSLTSSGNFQTNVFCSTRHLVRQLACLTQLWSNVCILNHSFEMSIHVSYGPSETPYLNIPLVSVRAPPFPLCYDSPSKNNLFVQLCTQKVGGALCCSYSKEQHQTPPNTWQAPGRLLQPNGKVQSHHSQRKEHGSNKIVELFSSNQHPTSCHIHAAEEGGPKSLGPERPHDRPQFRSWREQVRCKVGDTRGKQPRQQPHHQSKCQQYLDPNPNTPTLSRHGTPQALALAMSRPLWASWNNQSKRQACPCFAFNVMMFMYAHILEGCECNHTGHGDRMTGGSFGGGGGPSYLDNFMCIELGGG